MTKPQSPPFKCPNCEALYKTVRVEAAAMKDREITCRLCGGPLSGREGQFALKYFRSRPSGEFKRHRYSVV
jgi:DNA-directed RNA polymerase subunit RPC12/RpoP